MNASVRVGLVQQRCRENREENLERTIGYIRTAVNDGAQFVALQELHTGPYFCQSEDTAVFDRAEPVPGATTEKLGVVAKECGVVILASLFERRTAGLYHNTAVVLERDGSIAGKYRKMHIPDDPGYYEKFYFTPGDLGFVPIHSSVGCVGSLVCWDQWFPEGARLMCMRGADMLVYPTAIGWVPSDPQDEKERQRDAWITIQRAHAVANGVPVISVNRVGFEPDPSGVTEGIQFWGSSFVAGPQGEILAQASTDKEEVLVVDVDLGRGEDVRRIWPFLRDRRIDAYGGLEKRFLD
ncbi:MAG: beta-ureidopropionase [Candidatus Hydrogenedentota bacterium]